MSKHICSIVIDNLAVTVQMGWDKPMQRYYMLVEADSLDDDSDEGEDAAGDYYFSNLYLPNPDSLTLDHCRSVLASMGLQVPESMFEQTAMDAANNCVNRVVTHQADGDFVVVRPGTCNGMQA